MGQSLIESRLRFRSLNRRCLDFKKLLLFPGSDRKQICFKYQQRFSARNGYAVSEGQPTPYHSSQNQSELLDELVHSHPTKIYVSSRSTILVLISERITWSTISHLHSNPPFSL